MRSVVLMFSALAMAACSTLTPTDDPLYLRVTDLEARLIRIERVLDNESLINIATELDGLRSDTQALRGEIETLRFETENAAERQRDLYVDVDERLRAIEQGQARAGVPALPGPGGGFGDPPAAGGGFGNAPPAGASPQAAGNAQDAYDRAFGLLQERRYEEAANAFMGFLVNYPQSNLLDNAQYWLAESFYVRRQFNQALPEFQKVVDDHPQSAKLPDALLKVGYCNFELGNFDAARTALQQVARLYPDTTAARLAEQRLQRIAQEAG